MTEIDADDGPLAGEERNRLGEILDARGDLDGIQLEWRCRETGERGRRTANLGGVVGVHDIDLPAGVLRLGEKRDHRALVLNARSAVARSHRHPEQLGVVWRRTDPDAGDSG